MIEYRDIDGSTLQAVKNLLKQRNLTMPQYVDWKYGPGSPEGFRGVVAFDGDREVGCFGSIPLSFLDATGIPITVGWFADWYVLPSYQRKGLGKGLLEQLKQRNRFFLGHPGPHYAYNLCTHTGWKNLAFQSKYRWIFFPANYYRQRSSNWIKTIPKILLGNLSKSYRQVSASIISKLSFQPVNQIFVSISEEQINWMLNQPSISEIDRKYGDLSIGGVTFIFCDQILPKTGEVYRKLVLIDPLSALDIDKLKQFLSITREMKISYLELFTCSNDMDLICRRLRGMKINENPIVYTGFADDLMIPNLQGLHRENWLFQAGT